MAICAYCGNDEPATREHVIPAFLYSLQKQFSESFIGWNEKASRMIQGEAKIKDVCATCNNQKLGSLDSYAKNLLSSCGLLDQNYTKKSLSLDFDYSLLLRWLLKVSFNSSRTDGVHAPIFEEFIQFILGNSPQPPRHRVACILSLAGPELLNNHSPPPESFVKLAKGTGIVNPFLVRICYGGIRKERFIHRFVIIGPAVFQLVIFNEGTLPGHAASEIRSILKVEPKGVELTNKKGSVKINSGNISWLDLYGPQIMRVHALKMSEKS